MGGVARLLSSSFAPVRGSIPRLPAKNNTTMATPTAEDRRFLENLSKIHRTIYELPGEIMAVATMQTQKYAQLKPLLKNFDSEAERFKTKWLQISKLAAKLESEK